MKKVLVVANQTVGSASMLAAVRARAAAEPTHFHLVVPQNKPRHGSVIYDDVVLDAAQVRCDLAIAFMRAEGIDAAATAEVGDPDPFQATMDALAEDNFDEVIVSTLPATASGWLRRDLIERIQSASHLPVEHVVTDLDTEGLPFTVTLVVANQTASGAELTEALKRKAKDVPDHMFILVVPQASGDGAAAAEAREHLDDALAKLRAEGLLVAGMIGDPDPYNATMNALQFYRVDEVVISTLPATRSGWLREDLVGRVAKSTAAQVEHVVAERDTVGA